MPGPLGCWWGCWGFWLCCCSICWRALSSAYLSCSMWKFCLSVSSCCLCCSSCARDRTEGTGELGVMHSKHVPANQWAGRRPSSQPQTQITLSCGCLQHVLGKAPELTWFCPKTPQQQLLPELCTENSALTQLCRKLGAFPSIFCMLERGRTGISGDFPGKPEAEGVCSCRSSGITGRSLLHPWSARTGCHSSQTPVICTIKSFM